MKVYVTGSKVEGRTVVATLVAQARDLPGRELRSDLREMVGFPLNCVISVGEDFRGDIPVHPGDVVLEVRKQKVFRAFKMLGA